MYIIKAEVFAPDHKNHRNNRVATAIIKTHDIAAFMAMREQPINGVPDCCHVNVDTFVTVMGQTFCTDTRSLGAICEALMDVQQELLTVERNTVHAPRKTGNGAPHHIADNDV